MKYQRINRNSMGQFLRSRERYRFISHGLERTYMTLGLPPNEVTVPVGWKFDRPRGVTRFTDREKFLRMGGDKNEGIALDVYPAS